MWLETKHMEELKQLLSEDTEQNARAIARFVKSWPSTGVGKAFTDEQVKAGDDSAFMQNLLNDEEEMNEKQN